MPEVKTVKQLADAEIKKRTKSRWKGLSEKEVKKRALQVRNSFYRRDLARRATPTERIVMAFLKEKQVRFLFQKGFLKPSHRIADFYIPGSVTKRLIIEVDGGYHAQCRERDQKKDRHAWRHYRTRTVRITNEQVYSGDFRRILAKALKLSND